MLLLTRDILVKFFSFNMTLSFRLEKNKQMPAPINYVINRWVTFFTIHIRKELLRLCRDVSDKAFDRY